MPAPIKDMRGPIPDSYLWIIKDSGKRTRHKDGRGIAAVVWICCCAKHRGGCGKLVLIQTASLRKNKSCGCIRKQRAKERQPRPRRNHNREEVHAQIRNLLDAGIKHATIAKMLRVSHDTIQLAKNYKGIEH
jgi:hypothetical protein